MARILKGKIGLKSKSARRPDRPGIASKKLGARAGITFGSEKLDAAGYLDWSCDVQNMGIGVSHDRDIDGCISLGAYGLFAVHAAALPRTLAVCKDSNPSLSANGPAPDPKHGERSMHAFALRARGTRHDRGMP